MLHRQAGDAYLMSQKPVSKFIMPRDGQVELLPILLQNDMAAGHAEYLPASSAESAHCLVTDNPRGSFMQKKPCAGFG